MMRSELITRLEELFGDEDVYIGIEYGDAYFNKFDIYIDKEGDAVIKP